MNQKADPMIVGKKQDNPVADLIAQGHAVVRLENDMQIQLSIQRPRDEGAVLDKVIAELERTPEFAKKVFYSIPYENRSTGKTEYVEGISIGGSMAIARRWGNCANASRVLSEDSDGIICEGVFMDYETNVRTLRPWKVPRFYKPRGKNELVPLSHDALQKAIAAGLSKAVRNAVLHAVPEAIKIEYLKRAKQIATMEKTVEGKLQEKPLAKLLEELVAGFAKFDISKEELMKLNGKPNVSRDDYQRLLGTLNALEDGFTNKAEVLGGEFKPTTEKHKPVNLEDVI